MRNILAHDYFTRQSEIIWETLKAGLPELAAGCRAELARLGSRRLGGECPYRHRAHVASRCKGQPPTWSSHRRRAFQLRERRHIGRSSHIRRGANARWHCAMTAFPWSAYRIPILPQEIPALYLRPSAKPACPKCEALLAPHPSSAFTGGAVMAAAASLL